MDETKELGSQKIIKLLFKYSVPAIVGMLINAIYNIVDRIFIGNSPELGSLGIGGIALTFPIVVILMGIAVLFGNGGAILFSMYLGEKKEQEAKKVFGTATTLLIISGLVITVIGLIFIDPILSFFGAEGVLFQYAKEYVRIILIGAIFQNISMGLNYFVRADGHPKTSMITMLLGAIVNIILDPIFIYVFNWGMFGAAFATIIGQFCSAVWVVCHFLSKRCHFRFELANMKPIWKYTKLISIYGLSSFIIQISNSILNIVLNQKLVKYGGDLAVSVMGIINSLSTLLILPVLGLIQGEQPILSYNYGAGKYKRVLETVKIAAIFGTIVEIIGFAIVFIFPAQLIGLFNKEPDLLGLGTYAMRIFFFAIPIVGFQIVGSNYFQSVGKVKIAIFLTLSRQILYLIPLILILSSFFGLNGILYAMPISDTLAFLTTSIMLIIEYKKHYANLKEVPEEPVAIEENKSKIL